jgi:hypothetical protein
MCNLRAEEHENRWTIVNIEGEKKEASRNEKG